MAYKMLILSCLAFCVAMCTNSKRRLNADPPCDSYTKSTACPDKTSTIHCGDIKASKIECTKPTSIEYAIYANDFKCESMKVTGWTKVCVPFLDEGQAVKTALCYEAYDCYYDKEYGFCQKPAMPNTKSYSPLYKDSEDCTKYP